MAVIAALASPAAAQGDKPQYGGTLTVAFSSDTKTLDPTFSINFSERQPLYLIYNTLLALKPDFSVAPELAERWEILDNGQRVVLHLRKGVKFHDGTDFNAAAVKFNLDRRMDEKLNSPQRGQLKDIIDSVEVTDPYTATLKLKGASPSLLGMLAQREGFMVSPAAAEKYGKDLATNPVGTGPFIFKEWVPGNRLVVEKNPAYWEKGKPYLDRIVFSEITTTAVAIQRLLTGEADYASALSPIDVRQIENRKGIRLDPSAVGRWYALQWQVDKPPFNNLKLRQAIAHSIDRKRIVDIVMSGRAAISNGPTPAALWWADPALKPYDYDPAKAKALLAEAGHPNGIELSLATPQIALLQQVNQLVQEQLKPAGIAVKLDPVAQSDWYPRVVQLAINFTPMRWSHRPDPDGLMTLLFHSKGAGNSTRYSNPEVDSLIDRARAVTDQGERQKLYRKAQEIIMQDLPYVPLFFSLEFAAMRDDVKNHVWVADEIPRLRDLWKAKP
ncbi:ABC transporter substrate-binding protein [Limobrevibacterium gyesilva]|nr:ABC transporter substrate-binding protein [Limobrevibacterium gyesilva]